VGRRQALGWFSVVVCSVALIIAGGLVLSSVAVHRYLQASTSALDGGEAHETGAAPSAAQVANIKRAAAAVAGMPGVAATSCGSGAGAAAPGPTAAITPTPTPSSGEGLGYQISVTMEPSATAEQSAAVVFSLTQQLQNSHVALELTAPQGSAHAQSVIDYRDPFDAPVSRSTVTAVSQAVSVAAAVPGVAAVHVTVPYTWNISSGDLEVEFTAGSTHRPATALKTALKSTALAGVKWEATR